MCRLRIPGGYIKAFQMRELAALSREMSSGYLQITTRANIQLRVIPLEHAAEVLQRIQSVGLHTKGAGADNIRNITASRRLDLIRRNFANAAAVPFFGSNYHQ